MLINFFFNCDFGSRDEIDLLDYSGIFLADNARLFVAFNPFLQKILSEIGHYLNMKNYDKRNLVEPTG
jgi:hypothetical protein